MFHNIGFMHPEVWTPNEMSPLAWYDAYDDSTLTDSSGELIGWDDKGGINNLSQADSSYRPVTGSRSIHGRNVIDFNGSGDHMDMLGTLITKDVGANRAMFMVIEVDTLASNAVLIGDPGCSNIYLDSADSKVTISTSYYAGTPKSSSTISTGTTALIGVIPDSTLIYRINGVPEDTSISENPFG